MAANISTCADSSDCYELFEHYGLYLKPHAKVNVSVQLPQLKAPGKSISNWEVMEKLRLMVHPDLFLLLKVSKSTLDFIRFEGEVESKALVTVFINRLDGKTMKLSGFPDVLKIRAAETKCAFPTRHDWDSYFRDARHMDEMKPGERPDTIHFRELPARWFANRKATGEDKDKPSEYIVRKVFETFGEVRALDIPCLDPYRKETAGGAIQTFTFGQDLTFEAYVQYAEYIAFVKTMTALKGMKLTFKGEDGKAMCAVIKVDFDKTKHMSEKAIKKRRVEHERLKALEEEREERVRKEREEELHMKEEERIQKEVEAREREKRRREKAERRKVRQKDREEKRRLRRLQQKALEEERAMQGRIDIEERKILLAQRKLETIRIMSELCSRVKAVKQAEEVARIEAQLEREEVERAEKARRQREESERKKAVAKRQQKVQLVKQETELRDKILRNVKEKEERRAAEQREQLRKKLAGTKKVKSAIVMQR